MSQLKSLPSVILEDFEGPFDLLLELAKKRKVDIRQVALRDITDEFLAYIRTHEVPLMVQGDFLAVAARLLLLKVRAAVAIEHKEEEEDDDQLAERVRLYQKFRERAGFFQEAWSKRRLWAWGELAEGGQELPPAHFDGQQLHVAMNRIVGRLPKPLRPRAHLTQFGRTLEQCRYVLREQLESQPRIVFQRVVQGVPRAEVAVSLLAALEMVRSDGVELRQDQPFSDIEMRRAV